MASNNDTPNKAQERTTLWIYLSENFLLFTSYWILYIAKPQETTHIVEQVEICNLLQG